jgi:exodeoxyribonuclease-3
MLDARHRPTDPLVLCGDFNVAPEARDIHARVGPGDVHWNVDARIALKHVAAFGLSDCVRLHHEGPGLYSWWDYRKKCWEKNLGLRIDHVLATAPLAARCAYAAIDRSPRAAVHASDHVPVLAAFS